MTPTPETTVLKPCPVCGRVDAKIHHYSNTHKGVVSGYKKTFNFYYVKCRRKSCVKKNPCVVKKTEQAAIKSWNENQK